MKKLFILSFSTALFFSAGPAHAAPYEPDELYGYNVTRVEATKLGGGTTNGNERLRLKNMADIARASKPIIHRDRNVNADYLCDWIYDKNNERYVCQKNYDRAYEKTHPQPVPVCPFGYKLNYGNTDCTKILYPMNARLNDRGDGWVCNPGFHLNLTGTVCVGPKYAYKQCPKTTQALAYSMAAATPIVVERIIEYRPEPPVPAPAPASTRLPSTGPAVGFTLLGSMAGAWIVFRKKS